MKAIRDDHRALEQRHDALVLDIPKTFARRDDVKAAFDDLKDDYKTINDKLDRLIERR